MNNWRLFSLLPTCVYRRPPDLPQTKSYSLVKNDVYPSIYLSVHTPGEVVIYLVSLSILPSCIRSRRTNIRLAQSLLFYSSSYASSITWNKREKKIKTRVFAETQVVQVYIHLKGLSVTLYRLYPSLSFFLSFRFPNVFLSFFQTVVKQDDVKSLLIVRRHIAEMDRQKDTLLLQRETLQAILSTLESQGVNTDANTKALKVLTNKLSGLE